MRASDFLKSLDCNQIVVSAYFPGVAEINFDATPADIQFYDDDVRIGTEDCGINIYGIDNYLLTKDEFEEDYTIYNEATGADIMLSLM